jgi:uncharacterized protein (TIGR02145 family)
MKKIILLFAGLAFLTSENQAQTVTDIDGNVYNTVTIGTQVWMKENLKVTHYRNGDIIPLVTDDTLWGFRIKGARCYYNNDSITNAPIYGALYNWYTVVDSSELCPIGWHIPADTEWTKLTTYLGGNSVAGGKLKENGNTHWITPNTGATNISGFTALPCGSRTPYPYPFDFDYYGIGYFGNWWSSTFDAYSASAWKLYYNYDGLYTVDTNKYNGYSVRCIRNLAADINEIKNKIRMEIYPNPANTQITIELLQTSKQSIITVYNVSGQELIKQQIKDSKTQIDINNLASGIYFVKLITDKVVEERKIIKE